jgi:hypothetical protein
LQTLVSCISDRDRLDEKLRSPDTLALLKLHGCVSRTHDPELPLILTADQYVTHREGRKHLFTTFETWGLEYPVLFVGSSGQDPDLRALLLEVSREPALRPRFYLLRPSATDEERRFWESKRVTVIDGTLKSLIDFLELAIPQDKRPLLKLVQTVHPAQRRFAVAEEVSSFLSAFLLNDVEYVHESLPIPDGSPAAFYRGFDLGWLPVLRGLDVKRRLADTILTDIIIRPEEDRPTPTELYLIKAEAGAGKSVLLRRIAWEAATQADCLCVYLRPFGQLRYEGLKELHRVTQQRVFLFVDRAAEHASELATLLTAAHRDRLPITVLTAERANAWNMSCERLVPLLTDSFALHYLSRSEIDELVRLLSTHNSLGPHLSGKSHDECVQQFEERAGRQILVALHEATMGIPFEDILVDEFNKIQPRDAQALYLTVCVLNRLNVPVRAGLIARVHHIPFEAFRSRLFLPLEHVVQVDQHPGTEDYFYRARHPEIAQIVFDRILRSSHDGYNEYAHILANINLAYNTDRSALRGLLRARALQELFPDHEAVKALFSIAVGLAPKEAFLYQQQANYERIRPNGNLGEAERLLQRARELDDKDATLLHTLAEVKRARAEACPHRLEREKFRNEARALLRPLLNDPQNDRYARHTIVKLAIDDLRDILNDSNSTERAIDAAVRDVEDILQRGLQEYPDDQFLLTAEADYSALLNDHERSYEALARAFQANRRDAYIASRLAKLAEARGGMAAAREVLYGALQANRGDHQLNFAYAEVLRKQGVSDSSVLIYHYRRSFTKWDHNYEAQFWFARYTFESALVTEQAESKEGFARLRSAPMAFESRRRIRDVVGTAESPREFFGTIVKLEASFGFVERDATSEWIFFHEAEMQTDLWGSMRLGLRVRFGVGFTFSGAVATGIALA